MRNSKFLYSLILVFSISISCFSAKKIDICFTSDVHSNLENLARAKTLVDAQKYINPDTILLDAGDFSMGTLFQSLFSSDAAELSVLSMLGTDVMTLGNHEFDFGSQALVDMLNKAVKNNKKIPSFVLSNVDWEYDNDYTKLLKENLVDTGIISEYIILNKNDLKIAVIGTFGEDAIFCSPLCELKFINMVDATKSLVAKLKATENPDMIICLSHGGTSDKPKDSEDENLAKAVPELDLIISGHSHTKLEKPIIVGNTCIASPSAYSEFLGTITFEQNINKRWSVERYQLVSLNNENLPKDEKIIKLLKKFENRVNKEYLSNFDMKMNSVLTQVKKSPDIDTELGYLFADCIYNYVKSKGIDVDFAIVPNGLIRGTFEEGDLTVSEVFNTYSLGVGKDNLSGYSLVSGFLSGAELKNICEIDCSVAGFKSYFGLYFSGITYDYNPARLIMDKVTTVYLEKNGIKVPVEEDKLYRVVTDYYSGQMLNGVLDLTKGLISIVPKYENGSQVFNLDDLILYEDGKEIKAWVAIANELDKMEVVDDYSFAKEKVVSKKLSYNPIKYFANPSKVALIIYCVGIVLIGIIALLIKLIFFRKKSVTKKK